MSFTTTGRAAAATGGDHPSHSASLLLTALLLISIMWSTPFVMMGTISDEITTTAASGDLVRQSCFALIFIGVIVNAVCSGEFELFWRIPPGLFVVLGWLTASLSWAVDPAVGFRRLMFTTIVLLSVNFTSQVLGYRKCVSLVFSVLCLTLVLDWLFVVMFPDAIHRAMNSDLVDPSIIGAWRGIHQEKNQAGAVMGLSVVFFVNEAIRSRSWFMGSVLTTLSALFLVGTQSKTSIGFAFISIIFGFMIASCYRSRIVAALILAGLMVASMASILHIQELASYGEDVLSDPTSFTGRAEIWQALSEFASKHFWLGSGYGGFWGVDGVNNIADYGAEWLATIYEAHNGYLDLQIQVGFVGLVLIVGTFVIYPFYLILYNKLDLHYSRPLIASLLCFELLRNLLETSILDRANPSWVIILIFYSLLFSKTARRFNRSSELS